MHGILGQIKNKVHSLVAPQPKSSSIAVSDIYIANCQGKQLLRWDVAVKLLAIENYYGKNDFGFDLYAKMQNARAGFDRAEEAKENFVKLIRSWEERGYDPKSCIYVDNDLTLQNGAHRLAMAIYHGMPYINAYTLHRDKPKDFGEKFFASSGFSQEEMELIREKSLEIYNSFKHATV